MTNAVYEDDYQVKLHFQHIQNGLFELSAEEESYIYLQQCFDMSDIRNCRSGLISASLPFPICVLAERNNEKIRSPCVYQASPFSTEEVFVHTPSNGIHTGCLSLDQFNRQILVLFWAYVLDVNVLSAPGRLRLYIVPAFVQHGQNRDADL